MPSFGGLGNGIRHLSTGGPKKHHFVRAHVHHVEERLDAHRRVALWQTKENINRTHTGITTLLTYRKVVKPVMYIALNHKVLTTSVYYKRVLL